MHAQSSPALCDSMACSPPGSSVHGIFQATILEWVAISSSRGSSALAGRFFPMCHLGSIIITIVIIICQFQNSCRISLKLLRRVPCVYNRSSLVISFLYFSGYVYQSQSPSGSCKFDFYICDYFCIKFICTIFLDSTYKWCICLPLLLSMTISRSTHVAADGIICSFMAE